MPIGDLLAEISGEPSSPGAARSNTSAPAGVKRKASASSSLASTITKKPATVPSTSSAKPTPPPTKTNPAPSNVRRPEQTAASSQRPNGMGSANSLASRPVVSGTTQPRKNGHEHSRAQPVPAHKAVAAAPAKSSPVVSRPALSSSSSAPKKGSFAEIMARGAKAQQTMGKVGVIQHKAIDKPMSKKEREVAKQEQKSNAKAALGKPLPGKAPLGPGRSASTSAVSTSRLAGSGRGDGKGGPSSDKQRGRKVGSEPSGAGGTEKKVKKSSSATTGYTGTARPVPGAANRSTSARTGQSSRPGQRDRGLLAPPKTSRRDRYDDEYDEELDDFIDYDDEEEAEVDPYGRRAGRYVEYDSDGSSDMEAGMSDIDSEERAAERLARSEDKREQMLEEKLKREKEERKRRLAQGYR